MANLEALLFVSEDPQSLDRLCEAIQGAERKDVKEALDNLSEEYKEEDRGIQLIEIAGGYRLCTKDVFADSISRLFERKRKRTLSGPALETLAIVAYKQPITRPEIEAIRGVNVDGALHTLLERHLVKIGGRKEVPGRPFFYRTTKSFLKYFGLNSLKDLPKVEDITQGLQEPTEEPDVSESSHSTPEESSEQ
jgi:segregation and condensation protein B